MDECFSYHVQNLLPQEPGTRACLPGPVSWTASKGLADGGTISVLLCQLAGGAVMPAHLSLLMHAILLFLAFMLEYPNSGRYMPKPTENRVSNVPLQSLTKCGAGERSEFNRKLWKFC